MTVQVSQGFAVKSDWLDDIVRLQKGGTASLAIRVPLVDTTICLAALLPAIEDCLGGGLFVASPWPSAVNDASEVGRSGQT